MTKAKWSAGRSPQRRVHRSLRRGMALVVVMVTVILVALAAYGFNFQMTQAYRASRMQTDRAQARLAAMSGIDSMLLHIEMPRAARDRLIRDRPTDGGRNPFHQMLEGGSERSSGEDSPGWSFAVISPSTPAISGDEVLSGGDGAAVSWRFGWENESAKLNVAMLGRMESQVPGHARRALLNLPGATPAQVDAFLQAQGIASAGGSERGRSAAAVGAASSSGSASRGQAGQAGSPRQFARQWTGGDWDHNYRLDPLEQGLWDRSAEQAEGDSSGPPVAWRDYLTFHSGQRNENRLGQPRIFLNSNDLVTLHRDLRAIWPEPWADFVILARQYGLRSSSSSSVDDGNEDAPPLDLTKPATENISNPLDLIGARVRIESSEEDPIWRSSPFRDAATEPGDYLEKLVDDVTTDPNELLEGQVDVNTAPREVLLGIPGMSTESADRIVQARNSPPPLAGSRATVAWLLREEVIDRPTLREWWPWITVGGDCVSAQVVGYRDGLSPAFRCTVVLDARAETAVVREFREWQSWGRGFDIDQFRSTTTPSATNPSATMSPATNDTAF